MPIAVTEPPAANERYYLYHSAGGTVEKTLLRRIPKRNDQLAEEICESSIGNISHYGVEHECPCERIKESLLELVKLEMLVADALLVDADTLDAESSVIFAKPASIELVVWHDEEEDDTDGNSKEACDEEDDFPGSD